MPALPWGLARYYPTKRAAWHGGRLPLQATRVIRKNDALIPKSAHAAIRSRRYSCAGAEHRYGHDTVAITDPMAVGRWRDSAASCACDRHKDEPNRRTSAATRRNVRTTTWERDWRIGQDGTPRRLAAVDPPAAAFLDLLHDFARIEFLRTTGRKHVSTIVLCLLWGVVLERSQERDEVLLLRRSASARAPG